MEERIDGRVKECEVKRELQYRNDDIPASPHPSPTSCANSHRQQEMVSRYSGAQNEVWMMAMIQYILIFWYPASDDSLRPTSKVSLLSCRKVRARQKTLMAVHRTLGT